MSTILGAIWKDGRIIGRYKMSHSFRDKDYYLVEFDDSIHIVDILQELVRLQHKYQEEIRSGEKIKMSVMLHGIIVTAEEGKTPAELLEMYLSQLVEFL